MNKYISFLLTVIWFVACQPNHDLGTPFQKGQEVTLTANIGEQRPQLLPGKQRVSGVDAKEKINLVWDNGDKILVKVDDHSAEFTLSGGAGTGEGTFTGIMPADGNSFHVEYPINYSDVVLKVQQYVPNGFGKGLMKMSTKKAGTIDNGFTLSADNALLGLQLTGDGEIDKIVLSRNNAEGKAGDDSYTLLCPNITLTAKPTLFYIVVLPGTWEKGFTVEVFASDNSVVIDKFVKTSSITFGTDNAIIMPEKNVQNLPDPCMVVKVNDTLSINMMCVEGGTFIMGAGANEHQVTLSDYTIGQTEVTQELWEAVMGTNPNANTANKQLPVTNISWYDCQAFINKLNQQTGLRLRLPTEAEWEYAARGGEKSKGYEYAGSDMIGDVAWYQGNSNNAIHTVAKKLPNELGIYDMSGNVWEWCEDYYDTDETMHVVKSGSFYDIASTCRIDFRTARLADYKSYIGLRLVLDERSITPEPEYVDLGLSVKWATFNVGATSPEDYGDYFAWGETEPKENYTWSNYLFGDEDNLTEYNAQDQLTTLLPKDDAVHVNWGEDWRMPTKEEYQELIDNTTSEWVDNYNNTGVSGRLFAGTNGNTLFLPAAGIVGEQPYAQNLCGLYWSANCKENAGINLGINSDNNIYINNNSRSSGYSIRGVKEANK